MTEILLTGMLSNYNRTKNDSNFLMLYFSNMRVDSLAQMLTHGNIRAGMTVMVVDSCDGLVAGAVLERLGGTGSFVYVNNANQT